MATAFGADVPTHLQGTWVGKIGKSKVRFCITANDEFSSYYYEKYQKKISISVDTKTMRITELMGKSFFKKDDEVTARMQLKHQNDQLEGAWTTKSRQLQVRLRKQKNTGKSALATVVRETVDSFGCEYIFYEPIVTRFLSTRKLTTRLKEYPKDILDINTDLTDPDAGYDPTYLKFIDPMLRSAVINSYELSIRKYEFSTSIAVEYELDDYLSTSQSTRAWAGGARPDSYFENFFFKKNGRLLDVSSLVKVEALKSSEKIVALFIQKLDKNLVEECEINISELTVRVHAPRKDGLSFVQNGRNDFSDCSLPQTIPWSEIQPYLSNTGLRVMRDFIR